MQFVARSRDGALRAAVAQRRADAEGDALVPYREMGLASARHLEALMQHGDARALEFFLVVPGKREAELDADVATYAHAVRPDRAAACAAWRSRSCRCAWPPSPGPDVPTHWYYRLGEAAVYSENPHAPAGTRRGAFVAPRGRRPTATGWGTPAPAGPPRRRPRTPASEGPRRREGRAVTAATTGAAFPRWLGMRPLERVAPEWATRTRDLYTVQGQSTPAAS